VTRQPRRGGPSRRQRLRRGPKPEGRALCSALGVVTAPAGGAGRPGPGCRRAGGRRPVGRALLRHRAGPRRRRRPALGTNVYSSFAHINIFYWDKPGRPGAEALPAGGEMEKKVKLFLLSLPPAITDRWSPAIPRGLVRGRVGAWGRTPCSLVEA